MLCWCSSNVRGACAATPSCRPASTRCSAKLCDVLQALSLDKSEANLHLHASFRAYVVKPALSNKNPYVRMLPQPTLAVGRMTLPPVMQVDLTRVLLFTRLIDQEQQPGKLPDNFLDLSAGKKALEPTSSKTMAQDVEVCGSVTA